MLGRQAACERKLNEAAEKLRLYIADVDEKAAAQEAAVVKPSDESRSAALAARLAELRAVRNPHDQ
jgi:hypothetical protein